MNTNVDFRSYYNNKIESVINTERREKQNKIFVLLGQAELIENNLLTNNITDTTSFALNGNESFFNREWATDIFIKLQVVKDFHFLSYPQFVYLIHFFNKSFDNDKFVILRDNLRQLFPIDKSEYLEKTELESIEQRPDELPTYQAEQVQLENNYFYSVKTPSDNYTIIDVFQDKKRLTLSEESELEIIDISSDDLALDYFINKCIREDNFSKKALVKRFVKQPVAESLEDNLSIVNNILSLFGGGLFSKLEDTIKKEYKPSDTSLSLLKSYWGDGAEFRNLNVYRNPDQNNQISEISQGLIVDTIIAEYDKTKENIKSRDLFLTAPTGAGKSLLFQLPSFYVSNKGDVTIVVSPLIALMKDQVTAIIQDRKFDKVAYINSELSLIDRERIIEACKNGEIDVLYMSPELLLSYHISHFIGERKLGLLVIDEAHLITTWGRDFRVDYWFLGNHIRKIRKYNNMNFPMVAVTATAIYGGDNNMVFDSIVSLMMHNPHIFIGQVKRENIEFIVNNYEKFEKSYEKSKLNQTVTFIKEINEAGLKTLVYTPYTKHIRDIQSKLKSENLDIAAGYYGSLPADQKELHFRQFKSGEKKIMVSTKAFGMGVDISDIEVVYHHAPSGLLPDYVQEVGRVARKKGVQGYAALNYANQDQKFSKALHGMSSIKPYQLTEVLKKITKAYYKNKERRNLLLSVDDFGHIFEDPLTIDQKVLTALMMIEKDYLKKLRFNVLIARPKKMFVKVYARIVEKDFLTFELKYGKTFTRLHNYNGYTYIELDLDKLWYEYFNEISFPNLKHKYYIGHLFKEDNIEIVPQLKMSFERHTEFDKLHKELNNLFENIKTVFGFFDGRFFSQHEFEEQLYFILKSKIKSKKITEFILSTYSGKLLGPGQIEGNAFLQRRRSNDEFKYRVFNVRYLASFSSVLKKLNRMFEQSDKNIVNRYVTNKGANTEDYIRLGYFLEILELGTFEIKGGENPMVFIRLNDPERIERDSKDKSYSNILLNKTLNRHYLSNQIFDHFFLRSFTNEQRWDFIEDYFLGDDVDTLINNHPGSEEKNDVDIVSYLKKNASPIKRENDKELENGNSMLHFDPIPKIWYKCNNLLTLIVNDENKTKTINQWLKNDPVSLHKAIKKFEFNLELEAYKILTSKLEANHHEYYKNSLGLNMRINFNDDGYLIKAIVPYKNEPVMFYKWWCKNKNDVILSNKEKLELINKVSLINPSLLKQKHKKILGL